MDAPPERPFDTLAREIPDRDAHRRAVTAATLRPEPDCLPPLIEAARLAPEQARAAHALAKKLVETLRAKGVGRGIEGLIHEYDLSSEEGVALMCLAEALLRIPDPATRDALIRDKIGGGDWRKHIGRSPSLFVNAATWALVLTGSMTATSRETSLSSALVRLIGRGGEPLLRAGVDLAMRLLGEQFVTGRTIEEALERGKKRERQGFRYSFDMLGEAALTARDAERYLAAYDHALRAIGRAGTGAGVIEGPGLSIKLSALHPRYERAKRARVMAELYPRLFGLAVLARRLDVGINVDAEESERLELSLDLMERLAFEPDLDGWCGLGFVVQAYGRRAPAVIDWLIDLARRSGRRLMVRLVKGAYWDSEIKRAQALGLADFPVFTRKIHTDVSFLACARKMLAAPDAVYPQFATHNAATMAAVHEMAGRDAARGAYEFQCLHGMGEPLCEEVVSGAILDRPCRIYAPVGQHEALLAYLVRRLLENGANSSFVNRMADDAIAVEDLIADPVAAAEALEPVGRPHDLIRPPARLFGEARENSAGRDLADEAVVAELARDLPSAASRGRLAAPLLGDGARDGEKRPVRNPARGDDVVGHAVDADAEAVETAFRLAAAWSKTPAARAAVLVHAADLMERRAANFHGLLVREAGKTYAAAIAEVREAVDFLRYYASEARGWPTGTHRPLGTVVAISPWNFPLAIFVGQAAAALAAGNAVLAKPAEETPLIAAEAVALLREAGVPPAALQLLPGAGETGAALVADARCAGVLFTGSTEVARLIAATLAKRPGPDGRPVPLVAETGGRNAMVVDSSALPEQAVQDIIASAFDSAGQRCSALRLLCLQDDVADRVLAMLKGAMAELEVGDPSRLPTDIGPIISAGARAAIDAHVDAALRRGARVFSLDLGDACVSGSYVAPTLIEIGSVSELTEEVFGPVLHVLRFRRETLERLVGDVKGLGYGLTFGLHTRIDETVEAVAALRPAGNLYVNRNMIGAAVGSQPFGGHGLSGTGPKAGGPLYLRRLVAAPPAEPGMAGRAPAIAETFARWLDDTGRADLAARARALAERSPLGFEAELPGPDGEANSYALVPRGKILCRASREEPLLMQIAVALAVGSEALVDAPASLRRTLAGLGEAFDGHVRLGFDAAADAALVEDDPALILRTLGELAALDGPITPLHVVPARDGDDRIPLDMLVREIVTSVNTAAAGGNASLLALGG